MIRRLLIANRGEIACRVARAARKMGIETVAVFSEPDADSLHVTACDTAWPLGGRTSAESYLRIEAILEAAQATGADAVHPGYGFLSENPEFAEAVASAGLTFIGPPASAMRAMALKDAAKAAMEAAGVPVVPGYHGTDQTDERLAAEAALIGYPVLIKAVAGGGGKGMRRVNRSDAFADALAGARAEAAAAFGNRDVLVEKFIAGPRHIEIQVFGDTHGRVVHLYERDCSLQRRHQKVIEEAPAPGMTNEVRSAMGAAAVCAAETIGYVGAGTVEFIVDGSEGLRPDRFWFMEMNTRLQVEHPVTEAVTGVDLVEWQIRVAQGEALPDVPPLVGHAVEARIYAEDPAAGFLPVAGRLTRFHWPSEVRVETALPKTGGTVSPYYDPMIAKVITAGDTRAAAIGRLVAALESAEISGVPTNTGFLVRLLRDQRVAAGDVHTELIAASPALLVAEEPPIEVRILGALAAAGLEGGGGAHAGFALWSPLRQTILYRVGEEDLEAILCVQAQGHVIVELGGQTADCVLRDEWWINGRPSGARIHRQGADLTVFFKGGWAIAMPDLLDRGEEASSGGDVVVAPMPGALREVAVTVGEAVVAGARIAVLEAMKMEHILVAPRDGVVAEVIGAAGGQLGAGAPIVRLVDEK